MSFVTQGDLCLVTQADFCKVTQGDYCLVTLRDVCLVTQRDLCLVNLGFRDEDKGTTRRGLKMMKQYGKMVGGGGGFELIQMYE